MKSSNDDGTPKGNKEEDMVFERIPSNPNLNAKTEGLKRFFCNYGRRDNITTYRNDISKTNHKLEATKHL